jgi:glyoxylase-like metal-dependent hydrolase (beta-lactamase superfamily II)
MRKTLDNIYTSADGSIIKEKEFMFVVDPGCEEETVDDFLDMVEKYDLPIAFFFLTHFHWDHVDNLKVFRKVFPQAKIIGHSKNPKAKQWVDKQKTITLGETKVIIIPTPGHSEKHDDICLYLPDKKILFSGDIVQPQGFSYEKCNFSSPVPYFEFGDEYISSLKKLMKLDIDKVITGHGIIRLKNSIRITLQTTQRIRDIAKDVCKNNKNLSDIKKVELVFKEISKERNFQDIEKRLKEHYFKELDRKGILYFIKKYNVKTK